MRKMNKWQLSELLENNLTLSDNTDRVGDAAADNFETYINEKVDLIENDRKYLSNSLNSITSKLKTIIRRATHTQSGLMYHIAVTELRDLYEGRGITFFHDKGKYFIKNIEDTANILKMMCEVTNKSIEDFDVWGIDNNLFNEDDACSTIELNDGQLSRYSLVLLKPGNNYEGKKGKL